MRLLQFSLCLLLSIPLYAHRPVQSVQATSSFPGYKPGLSREVSSRDLDFLELSIISPEGLFKIHYTLTGSHAVSGTISDGIPDYVTATALAADYVHYLMVDSLGYQPPTPDGDVDGPELDIYIKNWGGSYYGVTFFGNEVGSPTYLVIDNDFVEGSYTTHGLAAMQVTIAHEFFHMVQLTYAHPFNPIEDNAYWYEISSVWFEEVAYPHINDYFNYVSYNFSQTLLPPLNSTEDFYSDAYGHGIFGQVLDGYYGKRDGVQIMREIWESLGESEVMTTLGNVLSNDRWHSSIAEALSIYGQYNAFTGSRAIPGFGYDDAALLPEVMTQDMPPLTGADNVNLDFMVDPLQIKTIELSSVLLGSYFMSLQERSIPEMLMQAGKIAFQQTNQVLGAISPNYWIEVAEFTSLDRVIVPISNGSVDFSGEATLSVRGSLADLPASIQRIFPNPFSKSAHETVTIDFIQSLPGIVSIKLFDVLGREHWSSREFYVEGLQFINTPLPKDLAAGIYFIWLKSAGKVYSAKLVILP